MEIVKISVECWIVNNASWCILEITKCTPRHWLFPKWPFLSWVGSKCLKLPREKSLYNLGSPGAILLDLMRIIFTGTTGWQSYYGGLTLLTCWLGFPNRQIHVAAGFMDSKHGNITWVASAYHVINPYQSIISPVRSLAVLYDIGRVSLLNPTRPDGS